MSQKSAIPDPGFWRGRRVFLTGHSGFVGGWTAFWLARLGAQVTGYALPPPTDPSFSSAVSLGDAITAIEGDVRDTVALEKALRQAAPEIVLHLAAQPLVREAFRHPADTFAVNVMGTVNTLEAARHSPGVRSVVVFTTDKVYRNQETGQAYLESDELGGDEPYSASKSAAELVAEAYRNRYFRGSAGLVTVRAGNIIGGGDWAAERLVPDAIRAFAAGEPLVIRRPDAVRPWQHVIDAVRGLLVLTERLHQTPEQISGGWNLGPPQESAVPVRQVVTKLVAAWGGDAAWKAEVTDNIPEAGLLMLDSTKATTRLGWRNAWSIDQALQASVAWYKAAAGSADMAAESARQIEQNTKGAG